MIKKVLFISWEGAQTHYMEGLFLPIFNQIQLNSQIEFHILHFSWADSTTLQGIQKAANKSKLHFTTIKIRRKPSVALGSYLTMLKGTKLIRSYIKKHKIDIVMPRATLPAIMVNRLKYNGFKIIFDADGLPIDERVDFSELSKRSWRYKYFKNAETRFLINADRVITRSAKSVDIHCERIGENYRHKFHVIINGRNSEHFKPDALARSQVRTTLNLSENDKLFVYCGSLGPQYGMKEMSIIFEKFNRKHSTSRFLILTGNIAYAENNLPLDIRKKCIIKKIPFQEVPHFLSAADIAFAIRQPTYSMQGVAPIKLGEYLLMGLPCIASKGIGDSEKILTQVPGTFLFDHTDEHNTDKAVQFAENLHFDPNQIREGGIRFFSIERSVESYLRVIESL